MENPFWVAFLLRFIIEGSGREEAGGGFAILKKQR